jgi:hypothetical protein
MSQLVRRGGVFHAHFSAAELECALKVGSKYCLLCMVVDGPRLHAFPLITGLWRCIADLHLPIVVKLGPSTARDADSDGSEATA